VLRFNVPAAPERYASIALAMNVTAGATALETAWRGLDRVEQLMRQCGIPQGMRDLGVPESAIPRMAEAAMKVQRLLTNNLRQLTIEDAQSIYRAAF